MLLHDLTCCPPMAWCRASAVALVAPERKRTSSSSDLYLGWADQSACFATCGPGLETTWEDTRLGNTRRRVRIEHKGRPAANLSEFLFIDTALVLMGTTGTVLSLSIRQSGGQVYLTTAILSKKYLLRV